MQRRFLLTATVLAGLISLAPSPNVLAQDAYPSRAVRVIVPFSPGGTSDIMGRLIASELGKQLNQPFVVDNKAGAGGAIGTAEAARATPDGYTLLLSGIGSNAIIHGLKPAPAYDSIRDFVHISQLASGPNVLVVNPQFPAQTFAQFIAWVKNNPGQFNFGQVTASSGHLTTEYLKQAAGLDMVGIAYRGGALALNDVLAKQIHGMFTNQDAALPHVQAGKLRALAVTSPQRNPLYPDVPTVAESGYPDFAAVSWTGLSAPKGTPQAIIDTLEHAMVRAFSDPAVRARLEGNGFVVRASRSSEYSQFVAEQIAHWGRVIQHANITVQ